MYHDGNHSAISHVQDSPLPAFDAVRPEDVVPGIREVLARQHAALDELEKGLQPTWSGIVDPLERIADRMARAWGTVSHLKARWLFAVGAWGRWPAALSNPMIH